MSTVPRFLNLCQNNGSPVKYHRDQSYVPCPCRTPEGYRDPEWHKNNSAVICNEAGMIPQPGTTSEVVVKGFVQPIQSTRATRLQDERILALISEVQADDHLAILPVTWAGVTLNFYEWGGAVEDWVEYNGRRFHVVNANLIPDPADGNPWHHWELGMRLVGDRGST